jgi:hypothetical protein
VNRSFRQPWLALMTVVFVAVVVAACGQVTPGEESQAPAGVRAAPPSRSWLTQAEVCADPNNCEPTGAHGKHAGYVCTVCHKVGGRLAFDPAGPAYRAGQPAPSFDAAPGVKTCSNVGCHSVPAGTFSYYFPDGEGNPALNTVPYGGGASQTTPGWYATGTSCNACHANPADTPSGGKYVWHSGYHANQGPTGAANQCQFCHPDATGSNGVGTAITNPALHGNGVVDVQARFGTSCFGCH